MLRDYDNCLQDNGTYSGWEWTEVYKNVLLEYVKTGDNEGCCSPVLCPGVEKRGYLIEPSWPLKPMSQTLFLESKAEMIVVM